MCSSFECFVFQQRTQPCWNTSQHTSSLCGILMNYRSLSRMITISKYKLDLHIHTHPHKHMLIHIHMPTHTHNNTHLPSHIHTHTNIHSHTHTYLHLPMKLREKSNMCFVRTIVMFLSPYYSNIFLMFVFLLRLQFLNGFLYYCHLLNMQIVSFEWSMNKFNSSLQFPSHFYLLVPHRLSLKLEPPGAASSSSSREDVNTYPPASPHTEPRNQLTVSRVPHSHHRKTRSLGPK